MCFNSLLVFLKTMAYDPKIPEEEDDMNDDSIKWAVVFIIIGVETAVGLLFQVRLELLVLLVMLLILYEVLWCVVSPRAQNRDQSEVQLYVGTIEVDVLAHVASRISSSPSIRHPGKFPRQFLPPAFFIHRTL